MRNAPTHANIQMARGQFRVRVNRNGTFYGGLYPTLTLAQEARDKFKALPNKRSQRHRHTVADHKQQMQDNGWPSIHNIRRTGSGYMVMLSRADSAGDSPRHPHVPQVYGGHFSGPDALARALVRRNELEAVTDWAAWREAQNQPETARPGS